jgi:hypothetical protein
MSLDVLPISPTASHAAVAADPKLLRGYYETVLKYVSA